MPEPDAEEREPLSRSTLHTLDTPCLVIDADRMERNIARLRSRLTAMGVILRPHLKSTKSIAIAHRVMYAAAGPAAVSTLEEAARFADAGVTDLIYAVGIAPAKLKRVLELRRRGLDLAVVLDSVEQAVAVAAASRLAGDRIPALIEIDCDGQRSGVQSTEDARLMEIGMVLQEGAELRGVLAHAGGSYDGSGPAAFQAWAEVERKSAVDAAATLRGAGLPCRVVSIGSTPTAHHAIDLDGVTEVRAGVFVLFDLEQAGIGVCRIEDIALSVLATVIGQQHERGRIIVDAGWMALSGDRRTATQAVDQGYGLVCDLAGEAIPDLIVSSVSQEHGIIEARYGSGKGLPRVEIGDRLRILPNHACATGAQHPGYNVVHGRRETVDAYWPRFGGW